MYKASFSLLKELLAIEMSVAVLLLQFFFSFITFAMLVKNFEVLLSVFISNKTDVMCLEEILLYSVKYLNFRKIIHITK